MIGKAAVLTGSQGRGRLEELGLTEDELRDAIVWSYGHVAQVTKHEPPNAKGVTLYNKLTRALRDTYVPKGWEADDGSNHCKLVNKRTSVAIVVASGDAFTGTGGAVEPSTRSRKGKRTRDALGQLALDTGEPPRVPPKVVGQQMWVLLVYVDKHEIRWELSLPVAVSKSGHIEHWVEEIVVEPIALADIVAVQGERPTDEIDIDVRRREA